ncbi:hypothetical protein F4801DRAFT_556433 [Xylaria longipes]|nr:hypothetical protein F4801DRAFT_556433 [Xylaria longipes]RYC62881.1 hypothetical protein CHU98_g3319 [Xylaria longipes]
MEDDRDYWHDCSMNGDAEGFPPQPQSPTPVKSGGFSYDERNGLLAGGFSRAPLEELRLLFRKNASSARRRAATKPWIIAQLRLYDITFDKSAKVDELRDTLEAAVKGRKCVEGGPPSIAAVQKRLATQFAQNREQYSRAVKGHKLDVNQWHKQNFSKLNDPSAEARYDLDFFFSKYFVDDEGLPAPHKTPEPIILWDLIHQFEPLGRRVDDIPGLSAQVTGFLTVIAWTSELERGIDTAFAMIDQPDIKTDHPTLEALFDPERFLAKYFLDGLRGTPMPGKQKKPLVLESWVTYSDCFEKLLQAAKHAPGLLINRTTKPAQDTRWRCSEGCVIVGWAKQVIPQMESWKSEIARLKVAEAKRVEREKEKAILATLKPHIDYARAHRSAQSGPFTPGHLVGSYMMHCRQLQDEYRCELSSMTLDVHAPTSTHGAIAAFNFGVIEGTMLLASSEESLELLREEQAVRSSDEEEEEEITDSEYFAASGKRKTTAPRRAGIKHFKRRLGGDHPPNPGRFYLQWAGCKTGSAYLVLDEDHLRTGYFDLDKTGMTARGEFKYRELFGGKNLVFTLLKIADTPRNKPDAWSSYCEEERWIRW